MKARSIVAVAALTLAGCTASAGAHVSSTSPSDTAVPPTCGSAEHGLNTNRITEIRGTGTASLFGLVMVTKALPVQVGEQVKIVWRMTGSGQIRLWASGPHGLRVPVRWGPDYHTSSNYHRPGEEWGAGYVFPVAGCWRLHAQRSVGRAVAPLWVVPR